MLAGKSPCGAVTTTRLDRISKTQYAFHPCDNMNRHITCDVAVGISVSYPGKPGANIRLTVTPQQLHANGGIMPLKQNTIATTLT
jgi:hypothetical protein